MQETILPILIFCAAMLYASVGHGGASGYLAVMALTGVAPASMKPAALVLNILVSLIAFVQFTRAGHFRWQTFWPFALTSIPFAYLGGRAALDPFYYKPLLATVLLFAAVRLFVPVKVPKGEEDTKQKIIPNACPLP